jgi:hypothetical protein
VPLVDQELVTIPEDLDPSKLEFDIHIRRGSFFLIVTLATGATGGADTAYTPGPLELAPIF